MTPGQVAAILFFVFGVLVILRVPVAFALGLACVPIFIIEDRLTPFLLMNEMFKSYNAFIRCSRQILGACTRCMVMYGSCVRIFGMPTMSALQRMAACGKEGTKREPCTVAVPGSMTAGFCAPLVAAAGVSLSAPTASVLPEVQREKVREVQGGTDAEAGGASGRAELHQCFVPLKVWHQGRGVHEL